ncbi:MAG: hypothetical protein ACRDJT_06370 [Actinomycetota bacterium]
MTALASAHDETPEQILRRFAEEQGRGRTEATVERYHETIDRLLEYLESLDPRATLDADDATRLDQARSDGKSFLVALGFDALIRVLAGFLREPWLPPRGQRRAGHRSLMERLLVFLRREGLIDVDAHRREYRVVREAAREARSHDYRIGWGRDDDDPWSGTSMVALCRPEPEVHVVVVLPVDLLEQVTERIRSGEYSDVTSVVTAALRRELWSTARGASMQAWGR